MLHHVEHHLFDIGVQLVLILCQEHVTAFVEEQCHGRDSGALIAVDEAVVQRERVNNSCRLSMDPPVVAAIWTADGRFDDRAVAYTGLTTKYTDDIIVRADNIFKVDPVVMPTCRQGASAPFPERPQFLR